MVNLISGLVGFPVATLTAAIFFNWLVDMDKARRLHRPVMEEWQRLAADTWARFDELGTPDVDEIDPKADKDWLPDAAAIRASGLAFIPGAAFRPARRDPGRGSAGDPVANSRPARGASSGG
jgi:hypothetical protein